ncbi:hypothetical protein BDF19DRAFT_66533 [Syncephalis fuscata]|nr:hypothetical protein BDF19DRAFT_66533 [Syncephalis fuscata]
MDSIKEELCNVIHRLDPEGEKHSSISQQDWREMIGELTFNTTSESTSNITEMPSTPVESTTHHVTSPVLLLPSSPTGQQSPSIASSLASSPSSPSSPSPPSISSSPLPPISSFVYPFNGIKAMEINNNDYQRLREGEFINDTIIDFYLKYHLDTMEDINPQLLKQTHIFNTFFYHKLTQRYDGDKSDGYKNVRPWTSKVDLFSKRFIFVPINENLHWYLALIGNLDEWIKQLMPDNPDQDNPTLDTLMETSTGPVTRSSTLDTYKTPFIAIFDSLGKTCYQTVLKHCVIILVQQQPINLVSLI